MAEVLLRLENISKYYVNGQNVVAGLNRVSMSFHRGEFVAITGESGSGKSTLGHILGGILPYEDGELYFMGNPTSHYDNVDWEQYRKDHIAFISQNYGILPGATVADHVISALRLTGMDKAEAKQRADAILEQVELKELSHRRAAKLSSGQKQRLSIARALAKPCSILVADEPTGNLDPENSEKVIKLLAEVAQDRLVILITHEYSEAQDYVTRHISLQDGRICADAQVRPLPQCGQAQPRKACKQPMVPYITGIQLRSRPVWCSTVLLFFILTAFAVFAFLGTYIIALDDTSTRIFESDAFVNGAMDRIVAVRIDGKKMTREDYDTILSQKYVESLERFGYVADMIYCYREGVDYKLHYAMHNYGSATDPVYKETKTVELLKSKQYIKTIPLSAQPQSLLTAGRLPENFYEVVLCGSEDKLGQQITVYLKDSKNWSYGSYIKLEATVVGVSDQGSGLYFHDDVGKMLTMYYMGSQYAYIPMDEQVFSQLNYIDYYDCTSGALFLTESEPTEDAILRDMKWEEVLISHRIYADGSAAMKNQLFPSDMTKFQIVYKYWNVKAENTQMRILGIHDSTLPYALVVSRGFFDRAMEQQGAGDQVSITIEDYAYTDRVIAALEEAGYLAISPYVLGSAKVDEDLAAKRVQTLTVCLVALAAIVLLQVIVLRALFAMQNEAYNVLSNNGLPYKTARNTLWLQVFCFALAGEVLGMGGILLCSSLGVERIVSLTKYLDLPYWALLVAVHMVLSAVAGLFIVWNLRRKVYPVSVRRDDLDLTLYEMEAAV